MMAESKKTGITEIAVVTFLLSILEPAASFVTGNPMIPDPFDKFLFGSLALTTWFLRRRAKKAEA